MKYFTGEDVLLGDVVEIRGPKGPISGIVVKILEASSQAGEDWNVANGGILIEGAGLGLSLTERPESDPELTLVCRAPDGY